MTTMVRSLETTPPEYPQRIEEGVLNSEPAGSLTALPVYDVKVTRRVTIGEPETTEFARIDRELVYFDDGAVRELTRASPNSDFFGRGIISPFSISATDAWGTGPKGFNAGIILAFAKLGYPVEWLHHQGRHGELPISPQRLKRVGQFLFGKSIARSAYHQHALYDDLDNVEYDTAQIIGAGDSRSSMTGEVVDAIGAQHERRTLYSDYIAACFEHKPTSFGELVELAKTPGRELAAFGRVVLGLVAQSLEECSIEPIRDMLGTLDLHPLNLAHEIAWIPALLSGEVGSYLPGVPQDSVGTRTHLLEDGMSQHESWVAGHQSRKGIRHIFIEGAVHLDLVRAQQQRFERFSRLLKTMREHDFAVSDISHDEFEVVIHGPQGALQAA